MVSWLEVGIGVGIEVEVGIGVGLRMGMGLRAGAAAGAMPPVDSPSGSRADTEVLDVLGLVRVIVLHRAGRQVTCEGL
ncbi:MAG: hypothetical protein ACYC33_02960 [Thermoleophilia bacterium]